MSRFLLLYIYKIYIYLQERVPYACRLCLAVSETSDSQKRRRLEAAGQENRCPEASSGRRAELETKPDTPIVPSVRSRVQQLTQRRDGNWLFSAYKFMHAEHVTKYLTDLYSTVVTKPSRGGIYCTTGFVWVASKLLCFLAAFQVMLKIADQKSTRLFTSKMRPAAKMMSNFCWTRVTVWELNNSCSL